MSRRVAGKQAYFQGVIVKNEVGEELFHEAKELRLEESFYVTGTIHEDSRSHFGYEIEISNLERVGESEDYPITPKEHGIDFLMDHRHLWLQLFESRRNLNHSQIR